MTLWNKITLAKANGHRPAAVTLVTWPDRCMFLSVLASLQTASAQIDAIGD